MSELKSQLQSDMKLAMKAGEKDRLGVIRLILAAIKQREVDERIELSDVDVVAVLDRMVKQRRESISQYVSAAREDLAEVERSEIRVIQDYLPQPFTPEEVDSLISEAIKASPGEGMAVMGKVMAVLKPQLQGRAEMSVVSSRVKALLGL
jgi:uncharacterized protein YqeY